LELLIALGEAQRRAGDPEHRATLLDAADRARRRGDAGALARAALAACRPGYISSSGFTDAELVAVLQAALDAITDRANRSGGDDAATIAMRARLLAKIASELVYGDVHRPRRVAASDEALALARTLADSATLFEVLVTRFFAINAPATLPERLADSAELLAVADTIDDPQVRFLAHWERARAILETGDLASSRFHADAAAAVADDLGQPAFRWMARSIRFGQLLLAGRLDDAGRVAREMFEIGTGGGQTDAGVIYLVQRFMLLFEQGRADEVDAELTAVAQRIVDDVPGVWGMVALLHCEGGRPDRAREAFAPIVTRGYLLPQDVVWLAMSQIAAEVVYLLDDRAGAAVLLDRLMPYPEMFSVIAGMSVGCTGYFLGLLQATLGRLDAAIAHLAEAADIYERVGAPAHLGRTQVAWARALLARRSPGDAGQARALLAAAVTTARQCGFVSVERRATPLLAES
jgi:hypothetical protein